LVVVPLSPKTASRVAALFAPADRDAVSAILVARCGDQLPGMLSTSPDPIERIRFAALRLSRGRLRELNHAVALAETDWRDLLVAAGFAEDPTAHLRWTPNMSKADFYSGKVVGKVLWYLHDPSLPEELVWARLRVFVDGSADSTFSLDGPLYGFDSEIFASFILAKDEYRCFSRFDEEDEGDFGIRVADLEPPNWHDPDNKPFEYLGIY
jgi:hypothetical protein